MRISLEGNIGAGKSTILQKIAERFRSDIVTVYPEPVQAWGDLLALYYADKSTWSLPFSLKVLLGFLASNESTAKISLVERSPVTCKQVFTKLLHQEGVKNAYQWTIFCDYYDVVGWAPDAVIYIDVSEATCLENITSRARDEEHTIELHELRRIQFQYEQMLRDFPDHQVVRIDGNADIDTVVQRVEEALKKFLTYTTTI